MYKFVTFNEKTGDSIDIIFFKVDDLDKVYDYIRRMGFSMIDSGGLLDLTDLGVFEYIYENNIRADLTKVEDDDL